MAHAGTPTDLAKQPATSSSVWQTLFSAVVILAIGVALATAALFLSRASTVPAIDRGYDAIEAQRGAAALSGVDTNSAAVQNAAAAKARAMSGVAADTSYDAIENRRALWGVTVDTSYDAVEKARALAGVPFNANAIAKAAAAKAQAMSGVADNSLDAAVRATSGVAADTTYNAAEKARSGAFSGTTIDPTTFDRTPRGAHGQLP